MLFYAMCLCRNSVQNGTHQLPIFQGDVTAELLAAMTQEVVQAVIGGRTWNKNNKHAAASLSVTLWDGHFDFDDLPVAPVSGRKKERMVALRPHTLKHIRGGWLYYTDTGEPVDGYGAQNMVTVQSGSRTSELSISGPTC
jgi:hypothetical protein